MLLAEGGQVLAGTCSGEQSGIVLSIPEVCALRALSCVVLDVCAIGCLSMEGFGMHALGVHCIAVCSGREE